MEPAGDDLRDDLVIDGSIASSEEEESSHFILQDTGDDRAGSSSNAASLLAKKRKRKAKEKEKRAKVRSWGEFNSCTDWLSLKVEAEAGWNHYSGRILNCISRSLRALELSRICAGKELSEALCDRTRRPSNTRCVEKLLSWAFKLKLTFRQNRLSLTQRHGLDHGL